MERTLWSLANNNELGTLSMRSFKQLMRGGYKTLGDVYASFADGSFYENHAIRTCLRPEHIAEIAMFLRGQTGEFPLLSV